MDICRIPSDSDIINAIALNNEIAGMLEQCIFRLDSNELWITVPPDIDADLLADGIRPTPVLELDHIWLKCTQFPNDIMLSEFADFFG